MLLVIESGAIYSATLTTLLILYKTQSWFQYVLLDAVCPAWNSRATLNNLLIWNPSVDIGHCCKDWYSLFSLSAVDLIIHRDSCFQWSSYALGLVWLRSAESQENLVKSQLSKQQVLEALETLAPNLALNRTATRPSENLWLIIGLGAQLPDLALITAATTDPLERSVFKLKDVGLYETSVG